MKAKRKDWIMEALREAMLFLEAPETSPRHWPISRGNLAKLITEAIAERKEEMKCRRAKPPPS